jgi:hypothetical protein
MEETEEREKRRMGGRGERNPAGLSSTGREERRGGDLNTGVGHQHGGWQHDSAHRDWSELLALAAP